MGPGACWPMTILAHNFARLTHLQLGDERRIASNSQTKFGSDVDDGHTRAMSRTLGLALASQSKKLHFSENNDRFTCPKWLRLCGLNVKILVREPNVDEEDEVFDFGFNKLRSLALESCCEVWTRPSEPAWSKDRPPLKSFTLRQEKVTSEFKAGLEAFLRRLSGLEELQILLDGTSPPQNLKQIQLVHGPTLRRLIWDERDTSKGLTDGSPHVFPHNMAQLELISRKCPKLVALGLSLDWSGLYCPMETSSRKRVGL